MVEYTSDADSIKAEYDLLQALILQNYQLRKAKATVMLPSKGD
jgi:hypothetical protein